MDILTGNKINNKFSRIFTNWIILLCIAGLFTSFGCSSFRNVRNSSKGEISSKSGKIESKNIKKNELKPIIQEIPADEKINSDLTSEPETALLTNNNNQANTPKNKIPTLREQMKEFQNEQAVMKEQVGNIQNEITNIKSSLEDIKLAIKQLSNPNAEAITGELPESDDSQIEPAVSNNSQNEELILSDENLNSDKNIVKKKETNNKNIKPKIKQKKVQKPFTIKNTNSKHSNNTKAKSESNLIVKEQKNDNLNSETKKDEIISSNDDNLDIAMKHFSNEEYNQAIHELTKISLKEKQPDRQNKCNYWLGESYFGIGRYENAVEHFKKVIKSQSKYKKAESQIMIAESLIRAGQIAEAKSAFKLLIEKYPDSQYIPRARKMLQQL